MFLTKPLSTGIICTALERGTTDTTREEEVYRVMAHLNRGAAEAMVSTGVNACTDVTGFGLLGHLAEMLSASGVSARLHMTQVPVMPGAKEAAAEGLFPAGAERNYRFLKDQVAWGERIKQEEAMLWCDPQTSGGFLILERSTIRPETHDPEDLSQ